MKHSADKTITTDIVMEFDALMSASPRSKWILRDFSSLFVRFDLTKALSLEVPALIR